MELVTYLVS